MRIKVSKEVADIIEGRKAGCDIGNFRTIKTGAPGWAMLECKKCDGIVIAFSG